MKKLSAVLKICSFAISLVVLILFFQPIFVIQEKKTTTLPEEIDNIVDIIGSIFFRENEPTNSNSVSYVSKNDVEFSGKNLIEGLTITKNYGGANDQKMLLSNLKTKKADGNGISGTQFVDLFGALCLTMIISLVISICVQVGKFLSGFSKSHIIKTLLKILDSIFSWIFALSLIGVMSCVIFTSSLSFQKDVLSNTYIKINYSISSNLSNLGIAFLSLCCVFLAIRIISTVLFFNQNKKQVSGGIK